MSFEWSLSTKISHRLLVLALCLSLLNCSHSSQRIDIAESNLTAGINAININTATIGDLASLPGIGQTLARRIVEFREKNGRFRRPEHLLLVDGISENRFREIRPFIKVE